jgi:hypothetical protein
VNQVKASHWSKDFVEHLRAVHFSLTVVAIALIIAGTNTDSAKLAAALTQAQQIAQLAHQWPLVKEKLYKQAVNNESKHKYVSIYFVIAMPPRVYDVREIGMDKALVVANIEAAETTEWRFDELVPSELATLAQFRDFWNHLHQKAVMLFFPDEPDTNSKCREAIYRITTKGDSEDLGFDQEARARAALLAYYADGKTPIKSPADLKCYTLRNFGSQFRGAILEEVVPKVSWKSDVDGGTIMRLEISLPIEHAAGALQKDTKTLISQSDINVTLTPFAIDEGYFADLYFTDWRKGSFDNAFKELNSVMPGIATLQISDAVARVESEAATAEKSVSLFGFTLPISQLSSWGTLVILGIQLYFWLHLYELAGRIEPNADGWDVAWIGVYRSSASATSVVVSCAVLPLIAVILMVTRIVLIAYYRSVTIALAAAAIILSVSLAWMTVLRLLNLRKLAKNRQEESVGSPDVKLTG